MSLSSNDISYFIEVASTLNLSRAAERLGISQPALSLAINRLEHSLGIQVLIRSKTGVSLTVGGKKFLVHAKNLLQEWESIKFKTRDAEQQVQGCFNIGMHSSVALYTAGSFIPQLLQTYPDLNLELKHDLSRKICEEIICGRIDLGIVVNPIKHPDLIINKLCTDIVTVWISEDFNNNTQNINNGNAVFICDPDLIQAQSILQKIKKSGIKISRILTTNSLELIAELTAKGAGIGLLPTRVANFLFKDKLIPIVDAPVYIDEICLLHRVELKNIQAIKTIKDHIKKIF